MLTVAIAGLGTVGSAVLRHLQQNAALITARAGQPITVKAVSARDKTRSRNADLSAIEWHDDPRALATLPGVDVVVELMGGAEGAARQLAESALANGKHIVTANKALIATHGATLARLAKTNNVQLSFEAAVAGGIPIIKTLRESLAGDNIEKLSGILNGTCNYILTRMRNAKLDFAAALAEAQQHGYAEADPSADIDGHDTANKLAILVALAFGTEPNLAAIKAEGIRSITALDLQFAEELGYRVKLLGTARQHAEGIEQRVCPTLIRESSPLARIDGALNAVLIHGKQVGPLTLEGAGAGGAPTANAVIADLIDIARGHRTDAFSTAQLNTLPHGKAQPTCHYIRLQVADKPGVVADISAILRDEALSIASLIQRGQSTTGSVPVILTTHACDTAAIRRALEKIALLPVVMAPPCLMPIED